MSTFNINEFGDTPVGDVTEPPILPQMRARVRITGYFWPKDKKADGTDNDTPIVAVNARPVETLDVDEDDLDPSWKGQRIRKQFFVYQDNGYELRKFIEAMGGDMSLGFKAALDSLKGTEHNALVRVRSYTVNGQTRQENIFDLALGDDGDSAAAVI